MASSEVKVKLTKQEIIDSVICEFVKQMKSRNGEFYDAVHEFLFESIGGMPRLDK